MHPAARPSLTFATSLVLLAGSVSFGQSAPKLRLKEVQDVAPTSYKVELNLDPAKTTFAGSIRVSLAVKKPFTTLWLNTSELTLQKVQMVVGAHTIAGTPVGAGDNFTGLTFAKEIPAGTADLAIIYVGKVRPSQPAGIFSASDGENRYLFTQFESTDARDAFPCFDEPTYKVPWKVTLRVPAKDVAVSNTPVENESVGGETKTVVFKETKPLPSYLVAFAVGPFEFVDAGVAGKKHVPVRIIAPKGRAAETRYAAEVTADILTKLEEYFGIAYPYEKADQVAFPIATGFAMENAGLVTYSSGIILADSSSDSIERRRTYWEVAAHELAHQWFGDLVTTDWWNDTWLNEAFATWMEGKLVAQAKPEWNSRASDTADHLDAEREDSLPSTRRIRQAIENQGDIDNAFDNITYQKGATVIGMFEAWIGTDKFQAGVRNYLNAHAFKTATTAEFLSALSDASAKDVRSAFSTFVDQPGVPVVRVALQCPKNTAPRLSLQQSRFFYSTPANPATEVWSIPVCVRYGTGTQENRTCTLLTGKSAEVPLEGRSCPAWIAANDEAAGYYRVEYAGTLLAALTAGDLEKRLSPAERVSLVEDSEAFGRANRLPYSEVLQVAASLHNDPVPPVLLAALGVAGRAHGIWGGNDLIPTGSSVGYQHYLADSFGPRARSIGWLPQAGESESTKLIRPDLLFLVSTLGNDQVLATQAKSLAEKWLAGDRSLDPNIAASVLQTDAYYGDLRTAQSMWTAYKGSKDIQNRNRLISASTGFRDIAALQVQQEAWLSGEIPSAQMYVLINGGRYSEATRKEPLDFVRTHYPEIKNILAPLERPSLAGVGHSFCDAQSKGEYRAFFEPQLSALPGMRRTFAKTMEGIDNCIVNKAAQEANLTGYLKDQ